MLRHSVTEVDVEKLALEDAEEDNGDVDLMEEEEESEEPEEPAESEKKGTKTKNGRY